MQFVFEFVFEVVRMCRCLCECLLTLTRSRPQCESSHPLFFPFVFFFLPFPSAFIEFVFFLFVIFTLFKRVATVVCQRCATTLDNGEACLVANCGGCVR